MVGRGLGGSGWGWVVVGGGVVVGGWVIVGGVE